MTDKLPPNLLQLFTSRPPLRYLPPADVASEKRKTSTVSGLATFLSAFDTIEDDFVPTDTAEVAKEKRRAAKALRNQKLLREATEKYDPSSDQQARGDPYCTLFVSRLSYDTTEHDLEREFGRFGPIERIRIVRNRDTNKNMGYAFVVFEHERDMKNAYKQTEGLKIRDRLVLVDVERGRTVKEWRPRRLGGGLGGRGYSKETISSKYDRRDGRGGEYRPRGYRGGGDREDRGEYRGGRGGYRGGYGDRPGGERGGYRGGGRGGGFRSGGGDAPRGRYGGIGYRGGGFENNNGPPTGPSGDFPPNAPTGPSGGGYGSGTNNVPVGGGGGGPSGFAPESRGGAGGGYDDRRRYDDHRDHHRSGGGREYDREGDRKSSHRREYDEMSRGEDRDGHRHDRDRDRDRGDRDPKRRRY